MPAAGRPAYVVPAVRAGELSPCKRASCALWHSLTIYTLCPCFKSPSSFVFMLVEELFLCLKIGRQWSPFLLSRKNVCFLKKKQVALLALFYFTIIITVSLQKASKKETKWRH